MTITVRRRPSGDAQINVSVGVSGMSAYEIAVANGFDGTEAEWLESLAGHSPTEDELNALIVPLVAAAVAPLQAVIDDLETRVAALEEGGANALLSPLDNQGLLSPLDYQALQGAG